MRRRLTGTLAFAMVLGIAASGRAQSADQAGQGGSTPAAGQAAAQQPPAATEKKPEPFAFADFTWLSGNPRTKDSPLQTAAFTGEFRADTNFTYSFNKPIDNSLSGSSEIFRSGEFQLTQLGIGGDFHYDNVQGRLMTQFGMYSTTTPRNDASPARGQWQLDNAYRYISEAYGGYHFNKMNGINVQAGIFMSYVGLWSYYNFDNWTYQPSYVSSNTPWFFNGMRVQIFTSDKLKIEPWIINGWQSYGKFNHAPGIGGQVLYRPNGSVSVLFNNYWGTDTLGNPDRKRIHTDGRIERTLMAQLRMAAAFPMVLLLLPGQGVTVAQEAASSTSEILRRIAALEAQLAELKAQVQNQSAPAAQQATPPVTPPADEHHDLTFGVSLDTYYMYNPARPLGRVNLLRAYDITSNNFSLSQASVVLESPVDLKAGRRFGGRVDLQYGQATETLQGSLANEPRPWVYRNIFQAYGTYVAPAGSGLTVDFGKWASSLGFEGNYTKDQINYSRSLYFNFLPFYHMGARVNYQASDAVALHYWITNGTQQTEAFNNFKDQSFGVVLKPTQNVAWTTQYYLGQEHPDVQLVAAPGAPTLPTQPGLSIVPVDPYFTGKLHIFDSYVSWQATPKTLVAAEADYVISRNPAPTADSRVSGGAVFFRQQLTRAGAIGARAEYLDDRGGLFTGASRKIAETTLTYDHRVADGFIVRSEWRRDVSSTPFFLTSEPGVLDKSQNTLGIGLVWWWGTKRDAW